jgi:hypothetical protein
MKKSGRDSLAGIQQVVDDLDGLVEEAALKLGQLEPHALPGHRVLAGCRVVHACSFDGRLGFINWILGWVYALGIGC